MFHKSTMLPVKVKAEKTDLEMVSARNRLDAVLQGLLEKSNVDREHMEDDTCKTTSDSHSKPSARFSHHRRKKRKEMEDNLTEGGQQRPNTYIIKLFDRSVDLAQFSESTPLYPICRAWMRNNPSVREMGRCPSPSLPPVPEDEEGTEGLNGKCQDVHRLPPPVPCQLNNAGEAINLRIPSPLSQAEEPININTERLHQTDFARAKSSVKCSKCIQRLVGQEDHPGSDRQPPELAPTMSILIYKNMDRWKKIRQRWKDASHKNQLRYAESMKILKEMYERQ